MCGWVCVVCAAVVLGRVCVVLVVCWGVVSGLWVFMVVVYGCEGGLVVVVLVLICVRIGFLCRFEG